MTIAKIHKYEAANTISPYNMGQLQQSYQAIDDIADLLSQGYTPLNLQCPKMSSTSKFDSIDTKDLLKQLMNMITSMFKKTSSASSASKAQTKTSTAKTTKTEEKSSKVDTNTYDKKAATTVNNQAGDGDKIVNNAYEKDYDGSEDKKLEKKEITVKEKQDSDSSASMPSGSVQFNTVVNGDNNKVDVQNNYYASGAKKADNTKTVTKMPTSSDFISNQATKDGITTYSLSNGMKVDLPEGTVIGDDSFYIDDKTGEASFSSLKGAKITGTDKADKITLYNCEDTQVEAKDGSDKIEAYSSKNITLNGGVGADSIKTVSCSNIKNNGGIGQDTIHNINCSGTVDNDGGAGKDKVTNDVYGVNKPATKQETAKAETKTATTTKKASTSSNNWIGMLEAMFNVIINGNYNKVNVKNNYGLKQ